MELSIIIINFNTPAYTLNCIESIKKHTKELQYEIILVDNAPKSDYKPSFLNADSGISYILSEKNLGFGKANNLGMQYATGKYLLLLNSDTLLVDNCLLKCFHFMESEAAQNIGLLGCKLLNEDGSYQGSYYPYAKDSVYKYFISNNPLLYKIFNVQKDFQAATDLRIVGDVCGAFMFLRRELLAEVKGFDPDFFLYCEETEWCRSRISRHFNICYYPEAQIIHLGGKSAPKEMMYIQSKISLSLYWYKRGWGAYLLYILLSWANGLYYFLSYFISQPVAKMQIKSYLKTLWISLPYQIYEIPRYGRAYGARPQGLIYKKAKDIFFA